MIFSWLVTVIPVFSADCTVTDAGRSLEPQETPLRGFAGAEPELVLAWAGVMLLVGVPVEKLADYDS